MREMREKQEKENNELEEKHNDEKAQVETKFETQEEKQNVILLKLKKTVEDLTKEIENLEVDPGAGVINVPEDGVEEARGHLECPICLEMMRPPTRIWQCPQSHLVCEICRNQLKNQRCNCRNCLQRCPTCWTGRVTMRAHFAENMARALFGNQ